MWDFIHPSDLPAASTTPEAVLREVSRDFAGAHVNADVVLAAIRCRLAAGETP